MRFFKRSLCLISTRSARVTAFSLAPHIKTLTISLTIFVSFGFLEASEKVIRGQIHGFDDEEGVWVGIVTGEPSFSSFRNVPHDDFESEKVIENKKNWSFSATGEFELSAQLEEEAVLLVIAKNRLPIEVALQPSSNVSPLELYLSAGASLNGIVQTKDGEPVAGATISILSSSKAYEIPLSARPRWVSGADGSFRLEGLEARSTYGLGVTADDFAPVIFGGLTIPDSGVELLEIGLEKGYFVTGTVIDAEGKPLSDIKIKTMWARGHLETVESDGVLKVDSSDGFSFLETETLSQSNGRFRIGPFEKGTTGRLYTDSPSIGTGITAEVTAPYSGLELRLGQDSIRGRVLDANSGAPLESFTVDMYIGKSRTHSIESIDGEFDLSVVPIDKNGTEITIYAPGYSPWTRRVFGGSSGEYDLGDIAMETERPIRGVIRDGASGSPVAGVGVFGVRDRYYGADQLRPVNSLTRHGFDISDQAGAFRLRGVRLRIDRLLLIVQHAGYASIDLPMDGDTLDIELHLDGVLEGSLTLPDSTPVKGVIELIGSNWTWPRKISSDGTFRFDQLTPDTYTLTAETDAGSVEKRTVVLNTHERLSDIDLVVQPGWSVTGTITGLAADEQIEIAAQDPESRVLFRKHFDNDEYVMHGLPPEVTLVARTSLGHTLIKHFQEGSDRGSTVDFQFEADSQLTGWLTSGGKPLQGVFLKIEPEDPSAVAARVTTTASGRYEAHRLSGGRHLIRTDAGHSFEVEIDGHTKFDIEVPENSLSGIVRGERTRRPVGDGFVRLVRADVSGAEYAPEISKRIGSDGTFLFEGLVAGAYDVHIDFPNAEGVSNRMRIEGPETIELLVQCVSTQECIEGSRDDQRLRITN